MQDSEPRSRVADTGLCKPTTRIIVLGMHRSGTSAMAGVLCGLGGWAGSDLMPPDEHNPTGYNERYATAHALDELLHGLGGSWDLPPWECLTALELTASRPGLRRLIAEVVTTAPAGQVPVIKDPRLSLFSSELESVIGPDVCFVLCVREPLAVARSLYERNGIPLRLGLALWETYNAAVCCGLAGQAVHVVDSARAFSDPAGLSTFLLGLQLPHRGAEDVAKAVAANIHPELLRQRSTEADDLQWLSAAQLTMWSGLAEAARSPQPTALTPATLSAAGLEVLRAERAERARLTLDIERAQARAGDVERWQAGVAELEFTQGELRRRNEDIAVQESENSRLLAACEHEQNEARRWREHALEGERALRYEAMQREEAQRSAEDLRGQLEEERRRSSELLHEQAENLVLAHDRVGHLTGRVTALEDQVAEGEAELSEQTKRAEEFARDLTAIVTSRSWRLGLTLTWPVRVLRAEARQSRRARRAAARPWRADPRV